MLTYETWCLQKPETHIAHLHINNKSNLLSLPHNHVPFFEIKSTEKMVKFDNIKVTSPSLMIAVFILPT